MAYKVRYEMWVDWVTPGRGLGQDYQAVNVPGLAGSDAQTMNFQDTTPVGSTTFTAGDITAILSAMTTDLSTQLNAQVTRIQGWASGGG
jgi:hypothetical protein